MVPHFKKYSPLNIFLTFVLTLSLALNCAFCITCSSQTQKYEPRTFVATAGGAILNLWDYALKKPVFKRTFPNLIDLISFNSIGSFLLVPNDDSYVRLLEPFTNTIIYEYINPLLTNDHDLVSHAAMSYDETLLAVASPPDVTIYIFDYKNKKDIKRYDISPSGETQSEFYYKVQFSKDGKTLLHYNGATKVKIETFQSPSQVKLSYSVRGGVSSLSFSPDEKMVVFGEYTPRVQSGFAPYLIKIFDSQTGTTISSFGDSSKSYGIISWSPDSKKLIASQESSNGLQLWNIDGTLIKDFQNNFGTNCPQFFPNGKRIIGMTDSQRLKVWDESGNSIAAEEFSVGNDNGGHDSGSWSLDIFPTLGCNEYTISLPPTCNCIFLEELNLQLTITASDDGKIIQWNTVENSQTLLTKHTSSIKAFSVSPDYSKFSFAADEAGYTIKLSDAETGCLIWEIVDAHVNTINSLEFSADGDWLASSSEDKTIKLWNTKTRCLTEVFYENTGPIMTSRFFSTGMILISFSKDSFINLWDLTTGRLSSSMTVTPQILSADLSSDDNIVAIGLDDSTVRILSTECSLLEEVRSFSTTSSIKALRFSPDNAFIATGSSTGEIELWNAATGSRIHKFTEKHSSEVTDLKFNLEGTLLASTSVDTNLMIWNIEQKVYLNTLSGHSGPVRKLDVLYRRAEGLAKPGPIKNCQVHDANNQWCLTCSNNYFLFKEKNQEFYSKCMSADEVSKGFYLKTVNGFEVAFPCHKKCKTCSAYRMCLTCPNTL